jgi:hypothetical protein
MMEPRQSTTVPNTSKASAFTSNGSLGRAFSAISAYGDSRPRIEFGVFPNSYFTRAFGLDESLQLAPMTSARKISDRKAPGRSRHETFRHTIVTKLTIGEPAHCQPWLTVPIQISSLTVASAWPANCI